MGFTSTIFLFLFFPIVILTNYILPAKMKNMFLTLSSIVFLFLNDVTSLLIVITLTICIYILGRYISLYKNKKSLSKYLFIFSIVSIVLLLIVFRVSTFLDHTVNISSFNMNLIANPIGLSFYTIQAISYIMSIYKEKSVPEKNFSHLLLYMIIFPKHFFGPVLSYERIMPQIKSDRKISLDSIFDGVIVFIKGLGKKVIIADSLFIILKTVTEQNLTSLSFLMIILTSITLFLYVYFLLSSYSDISICILKMVGITLPDNFNNPFSSKSLSEFFTRFNISFYDWLSNIININLNNDEPPNKKNTIKIFVFFVIMTMWYYPSLNMLVLSFYISILILLERLIFIKNPMILKGFFGNVYFIIASFFGMIIIMPKSLNSLLTILKLIFIPNINNLVGELFIYILITSGVFILLSIFLITPLPSCISSVIKKVSHKYYVTIYISFYVILFIIELAYIISKNLNATSILNLL